MTPFDTSYGTQLCYGPILHHFRDIERQIMACLEFWVRGHSRSLKVELVGRSCTTSFQSAVVTKVILYRFRVI